MTVHVLRLGAAVDGVNVTTRGLNPWRQLSPMLLGPVPLYGGRWSQNMENAWQFSKVYEKYWSDGRPSMSYWGWASNGWNDPRAHRYPAGKGAKPVFSWWAGEPLGYIEARKRIYAPLYAQAVRMHALQEFIALRKKAEEGDLTLLDFDAYNHRALGYSWDDVINDPTRKMGHAFVLAMMIDGVL